MAKKSTPPPKAAAAKEAAGMFDTPEKWLPWALAGLAFLVYASGFGNEMLGVDDHNATVNNPAVREWSFFNTFNLGMYAPLTWMGYAIAHTLSPEGSTLMYHLFSALVHAANCWLVFQLFRRLDTSITLAGMATFLFAAHPIQVESVAWIAGFSTPLYALFYLLACLRYIDYTDAPGERKHYGLALLFFVLACLAKSAAVTLPLALMVIDLWRKPALLTRSRQWLGYAPFLAVALFFGVLTIYSRAASGMNVESNGNDLSVLERVLVLAYTPVFYWYKMLLPFKLNIYYSFDKVNGQLPWPYFAAPAVLAAVFFAAWRWREQAGWLWFGLLFFFANLAVMLPFASHGTFELCADHYNYLSLLGIAFLLVKGWGALQGRFPGMAGTLKLAGYAWGFLLLVLTVRQIRIWKDTMTVVSNAIDNGYTQNGMMHAARGQVYGQKGDAKAAIREFEAAIQINPNQWDAYKYRGSIYGYLKQYEKSVADLSKYLEKYPDDGEQYYNRGLSYANLDRNQEAIADFTRTIELDSTFVRAYRARGNCLKKIGENAKGDADLQTWERLPK